MNLGDTYVFKDTVQGKDIEVTIAALSYKAGVKAEFKPDEVGQSGDSWSALEVKLCSIKGDIQPWKQSWQLGGPDGGRVQPGYVTGGPTPAFPDDVKLGAGDCVRGHILFAVPEGMQLTTAFYAPDSMPQPKRWKLAAG